MKECPYCKEEIQDTAKKCRYCGEFLDGEREVVEHKDTSEKTGNYSNCKFLKRGLFQLDPKVRCPKCGYIGRAKYKGGSYSGCLALILLCCAIIPGLLYIAFSNSGNYVCPRCGEDHLEKL